MKKLLCCALLCVSFSLVGCNTVETEKLNNQIKDLTIQIKNKNDNIANLESKIKTLESEHEKSQDKLKEAYPWFQLQESERKEIEQKLKTNVQATDANDITLSQKNALAKAKQYLDYSAFSRSGLIAQLEYEGYSNEDSIYAVDNCKADWKDQCAKKAKDYLNNTAFSRDGLYSQLEYEGFDQEQIEYGLSQIGY